jgi:hypothetical protein
MKFVPVSVTRAIGKAAVLTKKNQPHIFFVGGVIGVVGSTVLACRATLKLEPVLDEIKEDFELVQIRTNENTTPRNYYPDLARVYFDSGTKLAKLYGPSLILGGVSIAALTNSHIQLTRRNAALTAAYAGLSQVFDDYRGRVREELGEDRERDIYLNAQEISVEQEGKKIKATVANGLPNQYARLFDKYNGNWKPSPDYNRFFLISQQEYANDRLRSKGHVFLNDIYDWLGFERTSIGQIVGWTINSKDGDNYISFGLDASFNVRQPTDSFDGQTHLLDFNVEGIVWDQI